MQPIMILVIVGAIFAVFMIVVSSISSNQSLKNIKSKTVGDGQYGTARFATDKEINDTYVRVPYEVEK